MLSDSEVSIIGHANCRIDSSLRSE